MGAGKRKTITKKTRFEVFKRDSFACQYCGASAPNAVLHVDHIKPVSRGGDNSILNLITACQECNSGKSNIPLGDNSVVAKQKAQMDELNERREQLQMMMDWRKALMEMDSDSVDAIVSEINHILPESEVNDVGEADIRKWVKKYGYQMISECVEISSNQYLKTDARGGLEERSIDKFFSMIPRIAARREKNGDNEEMTRLYYARGILRNRLVDCDDQDAMALMTEANEAIRDSEFFVDHCKTVNTWSEFVRDMHNIIEGGGE